MQLTKKERLSFIYQLRMLEALYPAEAPDFANHRTALENGFTLHYEWMFEHLDEEMSEEDCREVLEILDMYRAINTALDGLEKTDALHSHRLAKFRGFDGNNESEQMSYARYFIVDLDRYSELQQGDYGYFNSHVPMLGTYQNMLERWQAIDKPFQLSRQQLVTVLGGE